MAHQIAHSDRRQQTNLVNCLRRIKVINIARDFCEVLLKVKGIISRVPDTQIQNDSELLETFKELEKLTTGSEPKNIILALLQVEDDTSDETKVFSSLFLNLKNVQYGNEVNYLKSLISAVEALISSTHIGYFELYYEPGNDLEKLRIFLNKYGSSKAETLLDFMFEIGIGNYDFTEEEKKEIGSLMPEAIEFVDRCIVSYGLSWKEFLEPSVLKKRSAIKFLLDDYEKFPSGDKNLIEVIDKDAINYCIGILHRSIEYWRDIGWTDDDEDDDDKCYLDLLDIASKGRLTNHTWWRTKLPRFYRM